MRQSQKLKVQITRISLNNWTWTVCHWENIECYILTLGRTWGGKFLSVGPPVTMALAMIWFLSIVNASRTTTSLQYMKHSLNSIYKVNIKWIILFQTNSKYIENKITSKSYWIMKSKHWAWNQMSYLEHHSHIWDNSRFCIDRLLWW